MLASKGTGARGWYLGVIEAGRLLLDGLDFRIRHEGLEHVPRSGPVVLAANHVSFPDFLFIGRALLASGRLARFMCRHDIWDHPIPARAMDAMGHIPVNRDVPAAAYLRARSLLRRDEVVCVFPEGGISAAYVVRAMMPGAVALAREAGAPLVPVSIWGSQRIWAQKRTEDEAIPKPDLRRGRTIDVRFGEPWQVAADADVREVTAALGAHLHEQVEALQVLPEHRPRPGEYAPWYPAHLGGHGIERQASFVLDAMPDVAVRPTWGPGLGSDSSVGR